MRIDIHRHPRFFKTSLSGDQTFHPFWWFPGGYPNSWLKLRLLTKWKIPTPNTPKNSWLMTGKSSEHGWFPGDTPCIFLRKLLNSKWHEMMRLFRIKELMKINWTSSPPAGARLSNEIWRIFSFYFYFVLF